MRGDTFEDLKYSKSGALPVDIENIQASYSYKKAREQSDRVLGIKPSIQFERKSMSNTKVDSLGQILLPHSARKTMTEEAQIELYEQDDWKFIILLTLRSEA